MWPYSYRVYSITCIWLGFAGWFGHYLFSSCLFLKLLRYLLDQDTVPFIYQAGPCSKLENIWPSPKSIDICAQGINRKLYGIPIPGCLYCVFALPPFINAQCAALVTLRILAQGVTLQLPELGVHLNCETEAPSRPGRKYPNLNFIKVWV